MTHNTDEIQWFYNEEEQICEGVANAYNMHITIEAHVDFVVYTASVEPQDGSQPQRIAPQAFKDLDEAKAWCVQEVMGGESDSELPLGDVGVNPAAADAASG